MLVQGSACVGGGVVHGITDGEREAFLLLSKKKRMVLAMEGRDRRCQKGFFAID